MGASFGHSASLSLRLRVIKSLALLILEILNA
jgi:hypothetical protein